MANSSNPFDFSDFQSHGDGGGSTTNDSAPLQRGFEAEALSSGFDPFAESSGGGSQFGQTGTDGGGFGRFGESGPSPLAVTEDVASPPVVWCTAAGVAAVAGVALAVLGFSTFTFALAGWALAGPLAIGLLAVHTTMDTKKRTNAFYSQPGWAAPLYWAVMVVAFAGVAASAWPIADWVGRQ